MKVTLAKTAGFCPGVKRAVDMAYKAPAAGAFIHTDRLSIMKLLSVIWRQRVYSRWNRSMIFRPVPM